ncbi:hypothetical protein [Lusitaniella coriacea]|uniref:hypothetical protein n=1 Tax=Lusitaniella coriacea TaxID=1983105 RepID=UPI003CE6F9F5
MRVLRLILASLLGLLLAIGGGYLSGGNEQPAIAQFIQPEIVAPKVYEKLPDFPLENQYVSVETGEIAPRNSLATRLLRYHLYVKSRPPYYRLDWKLTLADYLGVHDAMKASLYPGHGILTENPMNQDIALIRSFNRQQREALVDTLVGIFNPRAAQATPPTQQETPSPRSNPRDRNPQLPSLPQPGDADLLKF